MRNGVLLILLMAFLCNGCMTTKSLRILDNQYKGYQPIEPLPVKNVEVYADNNFATKPWASLSDSVIRNLLPNQSAQIAMRTTDITGKVNYLAVSVTDQVGSYAVMMDFMKYRVEDVYDHAIMNILSVQDMILIQWIKNIWLRINKKCAWP